MGTLQSIKDCVDEGERDNPNEKRPMGLASGPAADRAARTCMYPLLKLHLHTYIHTDVM
jgi:hypothetical protein